MIFWFIFECLTRFTARNDQPLIPLFTIDILSITELIPIFEGQKYVKL